MKIHFVAAVDGDQAKYQRICSIITKLGHSLVTDHYLNTTIQQIQTEPATGGSTYLARVQSWMNTADCFLFEVSKPDCSIGFEIGMALNQQKPTIVIYDKHTAAEPYTLRGVSTPLLQLLSYDSNKIETTLEHLLTDIEKQLQTY